MRRERIALTATIGFAVLVLLLVLLPKDGPRWFGDAWTYLAAAERLNAGSTLYALGPGDRPVDLNPPYWTVPLLSPPPVAVAWRPLVWLLGESAVPLWAAATTAAIVGTIGVLLVRRPRATVVVAVVLFIPIAFEANVANVNGLLLGGGLLAWVWRDRDRGAVVLGLMIAAKLAPIVLVAILVRRPRSLVVVGLTLAAAAAVSVAGAGLDAHLEYLEIARDAHPSAFSLPALTGVPWIHTAVLVGGAGAAVVAGLAGRAPLAYVLGVLTMIFGSPVVNVNTLALLLLLLVPAAFPRRDRQPAAVVPM